MKKIYFRLLIVLLLLLLIVEPYKVNTNTKYNPEELFCNSIIFKLDNRYALVENKYVLIDENSILGKPYVSNKSIMLPLRFTVINIGGNVEWDNENSEIKITYRDNVIRWSNKTNHFYINSKKRSFSNQPELVDSIAFFGLTDITNFTNKKVILKDDIIIIDDENKIQQINSAIKKDKNLIKNISEKFPDRFNYSFNLTQEINHDLGNYNWIKENRLIAHAFGGIERYNYTNSFEAFIENYNKGYRVFEVDLIMTKDNHLVARHDWQYMWFKEFEQDIPYRIINDKVVDLTSLKLYNEIPLTRNEFNQLLIHKKYRPLDFTEIAKLMKQYEDIYIITDSKLKTSKEVKRTFKYIVEECKNVDSAILNRIIPQIYNEDMLDIIKDIYNFNCYIYTLYQTNSREEDIIEFAKTNGIKAVTMAEGRFNKNFQKSLQENGIYIYMHTVNSPEIVEKYLKQGVYGFYTDFLNPKLFN